MTNIFIYGVPGVGKTYFARKFFKVARVLQSFLIREADELEISIKQSDGTSI